MDLLPPIERPCHGNRWMLALHPRSVAGRLAEMLFYSRRHPIQRPQALREALPAFASAAVHLRRGWRCDGFAFPGGGKKQDSRV